VSEGEGAGEEESVAALDGEMSRMTFWIKNQTEELAKTILTSFSGQAQNRLTPPKPPMERSCGITGLRA